MPATVRGAARRPWRRSPVGGGAYGLHLDKATRTIYVANLGDGSVSMIDTSTCNADHPGGCPAGPATSFPVPDGPVDVDVNALTHTAYVATLAGFDAVDTHTCNATTQAGCANRGHYQICDGCFGPFSVRVDESTNTIYEPDGSNAIVAMDGRACNADDLAGCATAPTGTVQLPGTGYSHLVYLAVDETLKSVYVLNHKDDTVVMIDGTVCNGRHPAACDGLEPEFVHTGTNPLGIGLDEGTHTLYVADQLDDDLSVIDAARCSAKDRSGCRRLPTRVHLDSPRGVAVSEPVHTAYVASGSDKVTMIDIRDCNMAQVSGCAGPHPSVTVGDDASAIAVDEARHTAYVANAGRGVSVLDTHTCNAHPSGCAVVGTLAVPQGSPADIVVNQKTRTLYVAASKAGQSDVVVAFDASTCNATTTSGCGQQGGLMPIGPVSACGDSQATSRLALAVDQPTNTVYAAQIPCDESVVADSVLVYDGRHCRGGDLSGCGAPVAKVRAGDDPFGLAVDEATRTLYAPLLGNGELSGAVAVIDVQSCNATVTNGCGQVAARAPAGFGSLGVAVDARSHDVYVTNDEDASVSVIDGLTCRAGRTAGCARTPTLLPTDDYPAAWIALAPSVRTAYVTSGPKGTVSLLPMLRRW